MSTDPTDTDIAGLVTRVEERKAALTAMIEDARFDPDTLDAMTTFMDAVSDILEVKNAVLERLQAERDGQWRDIATAPKNKKVLVAYRNALGNWRIVTACYHTQLPWSDEEAGRHEAEYAPEGWYEESDSSETIYRTSSPPTHWRHLPAPPSPGVQHD